MKSLLIICGVPLSALRTDSMVFSSNKTVVDVILDLVDHDDRIRLQKYLVQIVVSRIV